MFRRNGAIYQLLQSLLDHPVKVRLSLTSVGRHQYQHILTYDYYFSYCDS